MTPANFIAELDARINDLLSAEAKRDLRRADRDDVAVWSRRLGSVSVHIYGMQAHITRQHFEAHPVAVASRNGPSLVVPLDELGVESAAQYASWLEDPSVSP